ncbi:MAG: hypothetical protein Q9168_003098 [Polycauliona sp. 1 TL-2023]
MSNKEKPGRQIRHDRSQKLDEEKTQLGDAVEFVEYEMSLKKNFDVEWWTAVSDLYQKKATISTLKRMISMLDMDFDDRDQHDVRKYQDTGLGKRYIADEEAVRSIAELVKQQQQQQKDRLQGPAPNVHNCHFHKIFVEILSMGSKSSGMDSNNTIHGGKHKPPSLEAMLRTELEEKMGRHPHDKHSSTYWWCPIRGAYYDSMQAGHFFPSTKCGDSAMTAIFGVAELDKYFPPHSQAQEQSESKSELFRAVNGILWSNAAEQRFSAGLFVLVPDLEPNATPAEAEAEWEKSSRKEYRIRVLDAGHVSMQQRVELGREELWCDLDGRRVLFDDPEKLRRKLEDPSFDYEVVTFRPRASYVYWAYLEMMLRQFYVLKNNDEERQEKAGGVGKGYWGSRGSYIKHDMLRGFVEEMGPGFEHLMEAATDDKESADTAEANDKEGPCLMLAIMNKGIIERNKTAESREIWIDEDDEDSGENENSEDDEEEAD